MSKTQTKYPNSVLRYRERLGFTQAELAEMVGCKHSRSIRRIERGSVLPTTAVMLRIALALRVQIEFLYLETNLNLRDEVRAKEERMSRGRQGVLPLPS